MATNPPFALVRCSEEDMSDLVELMYEAFPPSIRTTFMGCSTPPQPGDLDRIANVYKTQMRDHPHDIWIGIKDMATGMLVAGSNYKVFLNGRGGDRECDKSPEWLTGEERKQSIAVVAEMNQARSEAMPGPFVYLHICFTDAVYRRRGAGAMMLQWGCDLADQLFLPGYIEASAEGNFLYKKFGFRDLKRIGGELGEDAAVTMVREARVKPIMGGRS
ncbi:hypothetical protein LTR62_006397 [Meristemomyces frigidus]|uniref:N-acetyltransferase domain-containing protein n=1 Tax=Meristemomyces frigidus TaxID=1508187 RepID=A0AAN7YEH7_9PEZI|nr:hypothetical protein LTR62_006397 [Meristemomyces frigidus]